MQRAIYDIEGLTSDGVKDQMCERIKSAISKVSGVQQVKIDLEDNAVMVEFESPATKEQLVRCIESAGSRVEYGE